MKHHQPTIKRLEIDIFQQDSIKHQGPDLLRVVKLRNRALLKKQTLRNASEFVVWNQQRTVRISLAFRI